MPARPVRPTTWSEPEYISVDTGVMIGRGTPPGAVDTLGQEPGLVADYHAGPRQWTKVKAILKRLRGKLGQLRLQEYLLRLEAAQAEFGVRRVSSQFPGSAMLIALAQAPCRLLRIEDAVEVKAVVTEGKRLAAAYPLSRVTVYMTV